MLGNLVDNKVPREPLSRGTFWKVKPSRDFDY